MVWGYLSEFWNAITQEVVEAGVYTIAWFESIGNAVAGAIGSLFEDLIHHIYDVFYVLQYLLDNLQSLFNIVLTPLTWIFNFVRGFFISAFVEDIPPEITWTFPDEIVGVFNSIPYWEVFTFGIGAGISILVLVFIFRRLLSF